MRALVVEDDSVWCRLLSHSLGRIAGLEVDCVDDADRAWEALIARDDYALVTVDISLVAHVTATRVIDRKGFDLLRRLRSADYPPAPALMIVSAHRTAKYVRDAFAEYSVDDFVWKKEFDAAKFADRARVAIREAAVRTAAYRIQNRAELTISIRDNTLILAQLDSPKRKATYEPAGIRLDSASFARRADELNVKALAADGAWRQDARALGNELYRALMADPDVAAAVMLGSDLSSRMEPCVMHVNGDAALLGVPFELMNDGNDYLCFKHIIARRLATDGVAAKKGEAFHEFVSALARAGEPLRVLLVASNSDGSIEGVDEEVAAVQKSIAHSCDRLGIGFVCDVLPTVDATYENVVQRLKSGTHQLFHYAGHGRFDDMLPEISGIVLSDGFQLGADELRQLLRHSALRMIFLSCCVSARSAQTVGRGDFYGLMDALVRAEVPLSLGYRWVVADEPAKAFAITFYEELFRTLSPGFALLRSRLGATDAAAGGRDNATWASPLIVCQNFS
jgi:DNA-binding response OmpR family regulator